MAGAGARGRDDPPRLGGPPVDQALSLGLGPCRRLSAWITPAPWEGVETGGHGRIVLEFDGVLFQVETSRVCRLDRPRWWVLGTDGGFVKYGIDPQEEAFRAGDLDAGTRARRALRGWYADPNGAIVETHLATERGQLGRLLREHRRPPDGLDPLAVTAEQGREVVPRPRRRRAVVGPARGRGGPVGRLNASGPVACQPVPPDCRSASRRNATAVRKSPVGRKLSRSRRLTRVAYDLVVSCDPFHGDQEDVDQSGAPSRICP